jgi:beta-xylosidase
MKYTLNMKRYLGFLIILSFLTGMSCSNREIVQQQVIPGELPDPSIVEVNGVFYATGSSNDWGPVYPVYKSTDMIHWEFVNYVFNTPPAWTTSSFWAPELFYHNGKLYCYYTAKATDGVSCIGVAVTDDPAKGFVDKGILIRWGNEAIDAFVYKEENTLYITWKAYGLTPEKPIQILGSQLSPDGLSLTGEAFNILTAETNDWEKGGMEGQCIVENNGFLYMLYSGNACCGGSCDYKVGVARAKTMKGPWEKLAQNPILESNNVWKCLGHGTAIKTGGKWYYLYHAYHTNGFPYLGRTCLLSEFSWDKQTGWPTFNKEIAQKMDSAVVLRNIQDDFDKEKLENWWHYDIPANKFTTAVGNGTLTLTEISRSQNNNTGTALCVIPDGAGFSMITKVSSVNSALKGLVFYATSFNSVGLGIKDDTLVLWKVRDNQFIELNKLKLDSSNPISLKGSIADAHLIEFFYSADGNNWNKISNPQSADGKVIGDNLAWWSWGMKAGLFVRTDMLTNQSSAVFDKFELEYQR